MESECLPCMKLSCGPVDGEDYCSICCSEPLKCSPCIRLTCGHIFHYVCTRKKIVQRWAGPAVSFSFLNCPLCSERISHVSLETIMKPLLKFEKDIVSAALQRLQFEGMASDPVLSDPSSIYYNNPEKYAVSVFAFYQCYKCKKPYFGGRHECAGNEHFQPSELICGNCIESDNNNSSCSIHGKDYIQYKCKFWYFQLFLFFSIFSCNIGTFFCWGTTHFCLSCHRKQVRHEYVTIIPRSQLPVCPGPSRCPLKIVHPPNGEEFAIGCALCKSIN